MKQFIPAGTTSKRMVVKVYDSSSTTGAALTGLAYNSAGLAWYYWREDSGNAGGTSVTLASSTRGTFTSGAFKEIDATNLPGFYEIGIPDAVLASGSKWAVMSIRGATNMLAVDIEIELTSFDPFDATRLGLTALPNANAGSSGGLIGAGTGTNQLSVSSGAVLVQSGTGTGQVSLSSGAVIIQAGTGTGQLDFSSGAIKIQSPIKKNTALSGFQFVMIDTGGTPTTGLTVTAQRSIDGGAFASCTNSVTELANGVYLIDLSTSDLNGKTIILRFSASGARDTFVTLFPQT